MKKIEKSAIVNAGSIEVWNAWTTEDGLKTFFAPYCNIELKFNGKFEILFSIDAPEGSRGSEGCVALSFLPEEMFSFSWNAPPHLPHVRNKRTWVIMQFPPCIKKRDPSEAHAFRLG